MTGSVQTPTVGIDLGTTNTVIAIDGKVCQLSSEGGSTLSSVVAFPPSGDVLVGDEARWRRPIDPKNTLISSKRIIGRRWISGDIKRYRSMYPADLVETDGGGAGFQTRAGIVTPVEVARMLLTSVCREASISPGEHDAVVAVPVNFTESSRQATLEAAQLAGFRSARLIDEPCATPLAHLREPSDRRRFVATYDFGGGTFDFAVLDCSKTPFEVLASGGDLYLGGDDIDHALANWVADEILKRDRWDIRSDREVFSRLVFECERVKILLTTERDAPLQLSQIDPAAPASLAPIVISAQLLADVCMELVRRTFIVCDEVLDRARLKVKDLDAVYCAGGATRPSMIREGIIAKYFRKFPRCDHDPMDVVSIGASLA